MKSTIWDSLWLVLALVSIMVLLLPAYFRNNRLKIWRKELDIDKHESVFNDLYLEINGFEASKLARQQKDEFALTYGEIRFQSFIALLSLCKPGQETIFYDLGSGAGKAVVAAAMVFPLKKATGIERLNTLDEQAQQIKQRLITHPNYIHKEPVIHFNHNDFLLCDWCDGNLIFINSTAIIGDLWSQLMDKLALLKNDAIVITTTKSIPLESYTIIYCTDVLMSWGIVKAYIHRKKSN
ncbi:hypothetical protein [Legionella sp. W05-934-2]|uniref:hypothetical protein n=1 Tax=Legionella sp. W05-934-2 TaxID=1198649 RepID=UPI003462964D